MIHANCLAWDLVKGSIHIIIVGVLVSASLVV